MERGIDVTKRMNEQRASNGQPGIASFNDGTVPGISARRGARSTSSVPPSRGTEASVLRLDEILSELMPETICCLVGAAPAHSSEAATAIIGSVLEEAARVLMSWPSLPAPPTTDMSGRVWPR